LLANLLTGKEENAWRINPPAADAIRKKTGYDTKNTSGAAVGRG
jgi:hypothetical protein